MSDIKEINKIIKKNNQKSLEEWFLGEDQRKIKNRYESTGWYKPPTKIRAKIKLAQKDESPILLAIELGRWKMLNTLLEKLPDNPFLLKTEDFETIENDVKIRINLRYKEEQNFLNPVEYLETDEETKEPNSSEEKKAYQEQPRLTPYISTTTLLLFFRVCSALEMDDVLPNRIKKQIDTLMDNYFLPEIIKEWGVNRGLILAATYQPRCYPIHQKFLEKGADVNFWTLHGDETPLTIAVQKKNFSVFDELVKKGANPFYKSSVWKYPFYHCELTPFRIPTDYEEDQAVALMKLKGKQNEIVNQVADNLKIIDAYEGIIQKLPEGEFKNSMQARLNKINKENDLNAETLYEHIGVNSDLHKAINNVILNHRISKNITVKTTPKPRF